MQQILAGECCSGVRLRKSISLCHSCVALPAWIIFPVIPYSDTDILIILKKGKYKGHATLRLEDNIYKRLVKTGVINPKQIIPYDSEISIILESIEERNKQLEKGRYFYTDIKKEGILLYDSGEYTLSEAKDLPWSEIKEIAQGDYEQWFDKGKDFLDGVDYYLKKDRYAVAAFLSHQATESFYNAILLVFSNYKLKLHDIKKLGSRAKNYSSELLQVFPIITSEQKECFKLLRKAYVDAQYDKNYKITKEQLLYLIERIEKLKEITERICKARISR
ncbi:HEPN domain-containing protein [Rickettsia endosymbiont of Gonocerus acuteangulatus]|uniref:HEPN domain-containing protein n=1 Tax=Rickettsia endosymbiont of Gonocerus acuteangulatus TaxID=3066266 RepID=UPI003132A542